MKNYKEYEKRFIGASDIAALILVGCDENGLKTSTLDFGEDGSYMAYVVDEDAEIGAHYKKVADFKHWLKIYDDDELTYRVNAQEINIYRAGDFGWKLKWSLCDYANRDGCTEQLDGVPCYVGQVFVRGYDLHGGHREESAV